MNIENRILLATGIVFCCSIVVVDTAKSQIVPDGTTAHTSTRGDCLAKCEIIGGTLVESNLFHSFQKFNVGAGESVYFADPGVANIFSRVTGNNSSNIAGILGVSGGDANLFLLNPNGIIFGAGASLDVNGSFVATTADAIEFGDRGLFASEPDSSENLALLTVNPSAFFFNQMGQNNPIISQAGARLTVPEFKNITFLGGEILLEGTSINAPEGKIELGAVAEPVTIGIEEDLQLSFPDDVVKGNILLAKSAIDVSGVGGGGVEIHGGDVSLTEVSSIISDTLGDRDGADINIDADNLALSNNSFISASTFDTGNGGNINMFIDNSVAITGENIAAVQQFIASVLSGGEPSRDASSVIHTTAYSNGMSGDISIQTGELAINNGAWIISSTVNVGAGGNVTIDATNSVTMDGSGILGGASANGTGKPGNTKITTQDLLIKNSGFISSSTLGSAAGGDLEILASESVRLQSTLPGTIIPTAIYSNAILGSGAAGNLTIDTKTLLVRDGSQISASSGLITQDGLIPLGGQGGNININATELVEIKGTSADGAFFSSIFSNTFTDNSAGNLTINTGKFVLQDLGLVSASSLNTGDGGNITINANESIELQGSGVADLQQIIVDGLSGELQLNNIAGGLFTFNFDGRAGSIAINTPKLSLTEGAVIATASFGAEQAGDLFINALEEINIIGSGIASPTVGNGDAGNIAIDTGNLRILEGGFLATATIAGGNAGDLIINANESVEISDIIPELLFSANISSGSYGGQGLSGNLTINTQKLVIEDGSAIDTANTIFPGLPIIDNQLTLLSGGNLTINASESIVLSGSSQIDNSGSRISSATTTSAPASNIRITTDRLTVSDRGVIAVNSLGKGAAGSLEILANSISLENGGNFNATTLSGRGGNINLQVKDRLYLSDRSSINTNAFGNGNGGNIKIDALFAIAKDSSTITANAIAGQGGNINIAVQDIFVNSNSNISASSKLGIDGKINIKRFTNVDRNGLNNLPETIIDAENSIVQKCGDSSQNSLGTFTYVGRGGLPPSPLSDLQYDDTAIADLAIPTLEFSNNFPQPEELKLHTVKTHQPETIVEAQGWLVNSDGNVVLTAKTSTVDTNLDFNTASCPFKSNANE